jgi:hypothetical protein
MTTGTDTVRPPAALTEMAVAARAVKDLDSAREFVRVLGRYDCLYHPDDDPREFIGVLWTKDVAHEVGYAFSRMRSYPDPSGNGHLGCVDPSALCLEVEAELEAANEEILSSKPEPR